MNCKYRWLFHKLHIFLTCLSFFEQFLPGRFFSWCACELFPNFLCFSHTPFSDEAWGSFFCGATKKKGVENRSIILGGEANSRASTQICPPALMRVMTASKLPSGSDSTLVWEQGLEASHCGRPP